MSPVPCGYPNPDAAWLARPIEDILEPGIPSVDAHHHSGDQPGNRYGIDELPADVLSGHRVVATVFVQAQHAYRSTARKLNRFMRESAAADSSV